MVWNCNKYVIINKNQGVCMKNIIPIETNNNNFRKKEKYEKNNMGIWTIGYW